MAKWLCQLLLALDYLQAQQVLHRDIKTSNLMLTAEDDVQLGDFGLATMMKEEGGCLGVCCCVCLPAPHCPLSPPAPPAAAPLMGVSTRPLLPLSNSQPPYSQHSSCCACLQQPAHFRRVLLCVPATASTQPHATAAGICCSP